MATETLLLRVEVEGASEAAVKVERLESGVSRTSKSTKDANKSVGLLSRGLRGLASGFGYLTGAAGIAGFGLGLASIIKSTEDFQDQQRQLGAALKSSGLNVAAGTKRLTEFADALSTKGGFTAPENLQALTTYARQTGSVTKSIQLETLATNIARGTHRSFEQSVRAVVQAEAGHISGLTRLGIVLPKTASATKALSLLQERYAGSTRAYSKTTAGAMQNFLHAIENLGEKLGSKLLPPLTQVFKWLTKTLSQFEHGRGLGGQFRDALVKVGDAFKEIWDVVKFLAPAIAALTVAWAAYNAVLLVTSIRAKALAAIGLVQNMLSAVAATGELSAAFVVLDAEMDANPIGIVVLAIGAVVAGLVEAYTHIKWFRNAVQDVWGWIKDHWKLLAGILLGPFAAAAVLIVSHWHGILDFFKGVPGKIAGFFSGLASGISGIFQNIVRTIVSAVNWVIRALDKIHVHVPGWVPVIGGDTFGFNVGQLAMPFSSSPVPTGTSGPGHRALGGYVHGFGHLDNVPSWLKPGEYVATDRMVKDVGVPAMEAWRHGGLPPGGGQPVLEATINLHLDGKQIGYALTRQGLQQKALR